MGLKDIGKGLLSTVWEFDSEKPVEKPAESNQALNNIQSTNNYNIPTSSNTPSVSIDPAKKKLIDEQITPADLKVFFVNLSAMEAIAAIPRPAKIQAAIISWSQVTGKSSNVLKDLFKTKLNNITTSGSDMQQDSKNRKAALGTRENEIKVFEQKISADLKSLEEMKTSVQAEYQKIDSSESAITSILNVLTTETNQIITELGV